MKIYKVITIRDLNFKDKSGQPVAGLQLWLETETDETGWGGWEVVKLWIPAGNRLEAAVRSFKRGDKLNISFNRRGMPETITHAA